MHLLGFFQNFGAMEIFLIFMIILLLFGAKRLPDLFRSFGKSLKEFKKATSEIEEDFRDAMNEDEKPKTKAQAERTSTETSAKQSPETKNPSEEPAAEAESAGKKN